MGLGLAVDEVALPSKDRESGSNNGRAGDRDLEPPIVCLRGVSISAWNPPPPQRKMAGDLLYLEVGAGGPKMSLVLADVTKIPIISEILGQHKPRSFTRVLDSGA